MGKSQELYIKAKSLIPGGTQLLSKRPEMHLPGLWPAYYDKAKGCEVWDLDGNHYTDMSYMGIGACILGYADADVNAAVKCAIDQGNMTTLNCPEEVELAECLCELHPWAAMARYARTGGEAMAMAVRICRAKSDRDIVLFCGYHGWHDWYLSANLADDAALDGHLMPGLSPKGVPRGLKGTAFPFKYNDQESFLSLIKKHDGHIAAVIMEPLRSHEPTSGFLELIRDVTKEKNIILVFDEITSGWRLNNGGAHMKLNIHPDMAVFGKGMSNGYPMAAVIGNRDVMEAAQDSFISSTYWTDRLGPAATLAAIKKMRDFNVIDHLVTTGTNVQEGWRLLALKHNLDVEINGMPSLSYFSFKGVDQLTAKTLFTQLMLDKGYLATTAFYASYAHKKHIVEDYLRAVDEVFGRLSNMLSEGDIKAKLKGAVCHAGFRRLT